jgi:hypothetical protein
MLWTLQHRHATKSLQRSQVVEMIVELYEEAGTRLPFVRDGVAGMQIFGFAEQMLLRWIEDLPGRVNYDLCGLLFCMSSELGLLAALPS